MIVDQERRSHAARNAALASFRLSATPSLGPCASARDSRVAWGPSRTQIGGLMSAPGHAETTGPLGGTSGVPSEADPSASRQRGRRVPKTALSTSEMAWSRCRATLCSLFTQVSARILSPQCSLHSVALAVSNAHNQEE